MRDKVFFDTAVLVYAISNGDQRVAIARELIAAGGKINVQVLNEFAAVSRRKFKLDWPEIAENIADVQDLCGRPEALTVQVHEAGIHLAERYQLNIYDALIVAAAIEAGCGILYTEDMQDGQKIGDLRIKNPFTEITKTTKQ